MKIKFVNENMRVGTVLPFACGIYTYIVVTMYAQGYKRRTSGCYDSISANNYEKTCSLPGKLTLFWRRFMNARNLVETKLIT